MNKGILKSGPGTYVLIFHCLSNKQVNVGKWGTINIKPGFYLYVGSAFGPGGINARVTRHYRINKAKHWHIDYLREHMDLISVWYSYDKQKLEHQWAQVLSAMSYLEAIKSFGCSDCQCDSHLFRAEKKPTLKEFWNNAGGKIKCQNY